MLRPMAGRALSSSIFRRMCSSPSGSTPAPRDNQHKTYRPTVKGDLGKIRAAMELIATAKRPVLYTGGGVINSGPNASALLRELARLTNIPVTSTLMGLGAYPGVGSGQWLGMLGMHGTYEANLAMHGCDVMINIGARFDDRITGRLDAFSPALEARSMSTSIRPRSTRTSRSISASSATAPMCSRTWSGSGARWGPALDKTALAAWWTQIEGWRGAQEPRLQAARTTSSSRNTRCSGSMN